MSKPGGNLRPARTPNLEDAQAIRAMNGDPSYEDTVAYHNAVETMMLAEYDPVLRGLTPDEVAGIGNYTSMGFDYINNALRKGEEVYPLSSEGKALDALDEVMARSTSIRAHTAYRAMVLDQDSALARQITGNNAAGTLFNDKAFVSTTLDPFLAHTFRSRRRPNQIRVEAAIRVPRGTHALYVGTDRLSSMGNQESELLLNRGLNYRIRGVRQEGGTYYADLEVVS